MKVSKKILAAGLASLIAVSTTAASFSAASEMIIEEPAMEEPVAPVLVSKPIGVYPGVVISPSTEITDQAALNEKLAEITLLVKGTLGIGDDYKSFNGDFSDNGANRSWYLYWNNDDESLDIQAAEDGTIMRYNRYFYNDDNGYYYNNYYKAHFGKYTREEAAAKAQSFLNSVLKLEESAEIEIGSEPLSTSENSSYYFNVNIKVNGLATPINANITVSPDLVVTNFYRYDLYSNYYGGFPEVTKNCDEGTAFKALSNSNKFTSNIRYYLYYEESDKECVNPKAELRYTFSNTGDWFVNCETGETVDRNKLYDEVYDRGLYAENGMYDADAEEAAMEAPMPTAAKGASLSPVEIENIEKLKGVLTGEEITKKINEDFPEFGIGKFELTSASFSRNVETDKVTASLVYSFRVTNAAQIGMTKEGFKEYNDRNQALFIRKYVTADGRTGEVESYSTSYPYFNSKYDTNETYKTDTQAIAEKFLNKHFADKFAETKLEDSPFNNNNNTTYYRYIQNVNGYKFDTNSITVTVNNINGNIDDYYVSWIDGVQFGSADNILTEEEALKAFTDSFEIKLHYITVPVKLIDTVPEMVPYINSGYGYLESFLAAYTLINSDHAYAVKAVGGEVLKYDSYTPESGIVPEDINNSANKAKLEKLAQYGVTFGTSEFKPDALATQLDMLILLFNSEGYGYTEADIDENEYVVENIYSNAVYRGFIGKSEKNPSALITTADVVRAIVSATEYGSAAKLKGIFKTDFADENAISEDDLPYFAIAKAIGVCAADQNGKINPETELTREELAMLIYNFLDR